ncbi:hypothetical protein J14TS5_22690 [Paenibacillus lautus]|uniref:DUF4062 domain-containing protein n=1 Tax=Paenibacillus lautus TaxID=1401 RepID=UPI001AFE7F1D|nr:DUF4062 domain-containing protein [Paenibacillus lautus]GIO97183.1 hypothetical protein J14TS5_22690 [Paenibacillus lautus]
MKPRVFVSSTYYDLKYIRNNIERFINQYGFESVLFESGNVYFDHNQELDISCYNEVKLCHMMILIIGGRYGAPSSEEKQQEYIESYERNYTSITRKEFREAVSNNIPVFIFIDKNVYSEYYTFKKNKETILNLIKNPEPKFNFAYVDSTHVFDFIDEVKVKALSTFERFDEIEDYLKNQFSGMFFNYLSSIRNVKEDKEILNSVTELQNISNRMNEMIEGIGRKVLIDSGYDDVVKKQNEKTINIYTEKITDLLKLQDESVFYGSEESQIFETINIICDCILNNSKCYLENNEINTVDFWFDDLGEEILKSTNLKLKAVRKNLQLSNSIDFVEILDIYANKIKPLFEYNGLESVFKETFEKKFHRKHWLPF